MSKQEMKYILDKTRSMNDIKKDKTMTPDISGYGRKGYCKQGTTIFQCFKTVSSQHNENETLENHKQRNDMSNLTLTVKVYEPSIQIYTAMMASNK